MRNIKIHLDGQAADYIVRSLHSDIEQQDKFEFGLCEIINITLCGALVMVPKERVISDTKLKITIPHEAVNLPEDTVIHSEIRWADVDQATENTKLGVMFTDMSKHDRLELKQILLSLDSPGNIRLPCHLAAA